MGKLVDGLVKKASPTVVCTDLHLCSAELELDESEIECSICMASVKEVESH